MNSVAGRAHRGRRRGGEGECSRNHRPPAPDRQCSGRRRRGMVGRSASASAGWIAALGRVIREAQPSMDGGSSRRRYRHGAHRPQLRGARSEDGRQRDRDDGHNRQLGVLDRWSIAVCCGCPRPCSELTPSWQHDHSQPPSTERAAVPAWLPTIVDVRNAHRDRRSWSRRSGSPNHRSGAGKLHPSSEDRRHGAVTSETVAFLDTPLPDMGTAAAEAWGIHNWSPQR